MSRPATYHYLPVPESGDAVAVADLRHDWHRSAGVTYTYLAVPPAAGTLREHAAPCATLTDAVLSAQSWADRYGVPVRVYRWPGRQMGLQELFQKVEPRDPPPRSRAATAEEESCLLIQLGRQQPPGETYTFPRRLAAAGRRGAA